MQKKKKKKRNIPRKRKLVFSLLAAIVIPALFLGGLEFGLRVTGFGYPTTFFLKKQINGRTVLVQNDKFGLRFFPSALVRRPLPLMISPHKAEHTMRIFVFGESAAMGDPEPAFSFGRILGELLRERFPGTEFEIVNVAFTAINSHVILPIARECAGLEGDLWVIYMGNNEMLGPFGAGTVFGSRAPNLKVIRASLALKRTRIGQFVQTLAERWADRNSQNARWEGLKMFDRVRVAPDDPARARVYGNFQRNLEDILKAGRGAGVPVILSTVASNLRDCAPFASVHALNGNDERLGAWAALVHQAATLQASGDFPGALDRYAAARKLDPAVAELEFRLGHTFLALPNEAKARESLEKARDHDALPFRANSELNRMVLNRFGTSDAQTLALADSVTALGAASTNGIPGSNFFYDHVHLTFAGNYQIALGLAEQVHAHLPRTVIATDRGNWAGLDQCAAALAWTPLSEAACYESMLRRTADAPFTNQLTHAGVTRLYYGKIAQLKAQSRETIEQSRGIAEKAASASPSDFYVREQFARTLSAAGETDKALAEWERARDLLPISAGPYFELGRLQAKIGKNAEAGTNLAHALDLQPQSAEIVVELARLSLSEGKADQAIDHAAKAIELNPSLVEGWTTRALAEERLGHTNDAVQTYQALAREMPGLAAARMSAGRLLSAQGKFAEAAEEYRRLTEIQPRNPGAFVDLANALAASNRRVEAVEQLRHAVELRPDFWQARYLLGVELAMQQKPAEAEEQFTEVIRLQPNYPLAHVNLGVALAQQQRLTEALQQFQETLRLDPKNQKAEEYISLLQQGQPTPAIQP